MCARKILAVPPPRVRSLTSRLASEVGQELRSERLRRRWTLEEVGRRAGLSASMVQRIESGGLASVDAYVRIGLALGLTPRLTMQNVRDDRPQRDADPVHATLGEIEATQLRAAGFEVMLDEPYQHFQFAGRADVVAFERGAHALLHIENRTRFPDIQGFIGSYNAKRAYLAADLARRLCVAGGFRSTTHVVVALWSSEVLRAIRMRESTFRSVCPDPAEVFSSWWDGSAPRDGQVTSSLVVFDPLPGQRRSRRRWVGLESIRSIEPRYRGYTDALDALRSRRMG